MTCVIHIRSGLHTLNQPSALFIIIIYANERFIDRTLMIVNVAHFSPRRRYGPDILLAKSEDMTLGRENVVGAIAMQRVFFIKK